MCMCGKKIEWKLNENFIYSCLSFFVVGINEILRWYVKGEPKQIRMFIVHCFDYFSEEYIFVLIFFSSLRYFCRRTIFRYIFMGIMVRQQSICRIFHFIFANWYAEGINEFIMKMLHKGTRYQYNIARNLLNC